MQNKTGLITPHGKAGFKGEGSGPGPQASRLLNTGLVNGCYAFL